MTSSVAPPLAGVRVVEFGHIAAGPFASLLLADLGADVVKLEAPAGDGLRGWPPFRRLADGRSLGYNFAELNRNKRSVCLDLKTSEGLQTARQLIANADVLIENYRPGVLDRLGLGFAAMDTINPSIVYCAISGYGAEGPGAAQGAFDVVVQAEAGLMDVTGEHDGPPVKAGIPVADYAAGQYAALAVLAALRNPRSKPVRLDCSMVESVLSFGSMQVSEYWGKGAPPQRLGTAHPRNAPYQGFEARDAMVVVAAGNDRLFAALCQVLGVSELVDDPRFTGVDGRVRHQRDLELVLKPLFACRWADELVKELRTAGVPTAKVKSVAEALEGEQLTFRGFVGEGVAPDGSSMARLRLPVQFDSVNEFVNRPAPMLGEHTASVVEEWTGADRPRVG